MANQNTTGIRRDFRFGYEQITDIQVDADGNTISIRFRIDHSNEPNLNGDVFTSLALFNYQAEMILSTDMRLRKTWKLEKYDWKEEGF